MIKKNMILLLTVVLVISSSSYALNGDLGLAADEFTDGSAAHPWLIEDVADFQTFCNDDTKWAATEYVRLEADLDLDPALAGRQIYTHSPIAGDTNSAVIHLQGTVFAGHFDGKGHTISNLAVSGQDYCGLFGVTVPGSSISNLGVINVNIVGSANSACLGGLVGQNGGSISKCYSTGQVKGVSISSYLGGLVGWNDTGSIANCYSTVSVIGGAFLGGLVGLLNTGDIINCYSNGPIGSYYYGYPYVGGLIAARNGGTVTSSCWDINTSGLLASAAGNPATTAQMQTIGIFLAAGWDFDFIDGDIADWYMGPDAYPVLTYRDSLPGSGTQDAPYTINDLIDFYIFSYTVNAHRYWSEGVHIGLKTDIDLVSFSFNKAIIAPDIDDVTNGYQGIEYAGHFDGNNHTVSNLSISGHRYCGLFGFISATGNVSDLTVCNASIAGGEESGNLGCLAGKNYGTITNCNCSGFVQGGLLSMSVGGLVGSSFMGTISNCHSTAQISTGAESKFTGGLIGRVDQDIIRDSSSTGSVNGGLGSSVLGGLVGINLDGEIGNCSASGAVAGGQSTYLGGLVGVNYGNESVIRNCYAKGAVSSGLSGSNLGGLVGENDEGRIEFCYSNGSIYSGSLGGRNVGGIVGLNDAGVVESCFWDVNVSGIGLAGDNNHGAIGKTTIQMQDVNTFVDAGWDFNAETTNGTDNLWHMPYQAIGYPMHGWQRDIPGDLAGSYGVDMHDFAKLSDNWLDAGGTDFEDLDVLAQHWLVGN